MSLCHLFKVVVSVAVGIVGIVGRVEEPSNWNQSSLASTTTWKQKQKIVQFVSLMSSLSALNSRVSVVIGTVVDIANGELVSTVV